MLVYFTDSQLICKIIWFMPQKSSYGHMALYYMIRLLVPFIVSQRNYVFLVYKTLPLKESYIICHAILILDLPVSTGEQWHIRAIVRHRVGERAVAKLCGKTMGADAFV